MFYGIIGLRVAECRVIGLGLCRNFRKLVITHTVLENQMEKKMERCPEELQNA